MDESDGLSIAIEQVAGGDVDKREFGRVVGQLDGTEATSVAPESVMGIWKLAPLATGAAAGRA